MATDIQNGPPAGGAKPAEQESGPATERRDPALRQALASALKILSRRDHSTTELARKLLRRGYGEQAVGWAVAECRRLSYLDDERTARQMIGGLRRRGMGAQRIRGELVKRGLAGDLIEAMLADGLSEADERQAALRVAIKKWKTLGSIADPMRKKLRLWRFLRYRGFADSLIFDVIKELGADQ